MIGEEAEKLPSEERPLGDVGGYWDVGLHTGVLPLSTCWPLVEQVFRHQAAQVRIHDLESPRVTAITEL